MKTHVLTVSRLIGFYKTDYISCELRAKSTEKLNDISTTVNMIVCATPRVGIRNSITRFVPDCNHD
jgi:hypothetical protein